MSFKKEINKKILLSESIEKDITHYNAKNKSIHRWFPYLEGFDESFISSCLDSLLLSPSFMYEPFAGSGTVPVFCLKNNIDVVYDEVNPFLNHLIEVKRLVHKLNKIEKKSLSHLLLEISNLISLELVNKKPSKKLKKNYLSAFKNSIYFDRETFDSVLKMRTFINDIDDINARKIIEIAACESLLPASQLKRAGDIRFRKGKELEKIEDYIPRVVKKIKFIVEDILSINDNYQNKIFEGNKNAKKLNKSILNKIDCVVTSPPYLNGTNYIKNTKLELWFLGHIKGQDDLRKFKDEVITAGINDVTSESKCRVKIPIIEELLKNDALWYDKRIPKMINDYFNDMFIVLNNIQSYLNDKGYVFIDIGDSIYGGIHIPTDLILIKLAESIDFKIIDNIKLRTRRSNNGQLLKQTLIVCQK